MAEEQETPESVCGFESTRASWEGTQVQWSDTTSTNSIYCSRDIWRDTGRCIWHAEVKNKPICDLKNSRTDQPEILDGAYLVGVTAGDEVSFRGCRLRHSNLSGADFDEGDFSEADLDSSDMSGASFRRVDFVNTNLEEATVVDSNLLGAKFVDSSLKNANLSDSEVEYALFSESNLELTKFQNSELKEANFDNNYAQYAIFNEAGLGQVKFSEDYLRGVRFRNSSLVDSKFSNVDLFEAEFHSADLRRVNILDGHLRRAQFPEADVRRAKLKNVDLRETEFRESNLTRAEVEDVVAQDAQFHAANFQQTLLTRTDLRSASLAHVHLDQVIFSDMRIDSTTDFGDSPDEWGPVCVYELHPEATEPPGDRDPLQAAEWVYRRLQKLHEENALSEEARGFHVRKEEARRQQQKQKLTEARGQLSEDLADNNTDDAYRSFVEMLRWDTRFSVSTLQWHLTRHGESIRQIFVSAGVLILACGLLYPFVGGFESSANGTGYRIPLTEAYRVLSLDGVETLLQGIYFSIITFTTIGYGDLYPTGTGSKVLVGFESLAGATLIALFVFVLGRQVAR